ncbi:MULTISPECIES: substrate-binding periplasmic protein [unclassified Marinobacter]|uniref:substrate-binding periplasmic protein n=1 Tax=unclassified Marinobacter TaxID=83889 RepID=UPI0019069A92|nr:transporter substrate-binding domain-containing protein [Marinobacter sp. 1-4A]MBK1852577.1 transporter substrate-binding domain-containing protein [Marinobacter sp. 1-4A]
MKYRKPHWFIAFTRRSAFFLPLLAMFLCSNAAAESDANVFRLNISPNGYPPYMITDQEEPSGIMWDVVSLITERLGYQLVAEKIPRKRVDQMLLDGYVDATPRAFEWTHEPESFLFTEPVVDIQEVLFTPKHAEETYQTAEDLFSKTVVTHLGYLYPELQPHFESGAIKRFDVSQDRDMFNFLLHGDRFDAAVADLLVGKWILKNEGLQDQFTVSSADISSCGFRLMLRKDSQLFVDKFNAELARIRESGELEAILANYQ